MSAGVKETDGANECMEETKQTSEAEGDCEDYPPSSSSEATLTAIATPENDIMELEEVDPTKHTKVEDMDVDVPDARVDQVDTGNIESSLKEDATESNAENEEQPDDETDGPTSTNTANAAVIVPEEQEDASVYHVKWIQFHNKQVPIVTQNENGPCPLIAIANVLLLRQVVRLPPNTELVTSQQIIEYFANYLLSADIKGLNNEQRASFQQNMDDAFTLFPKLQTGLDMNLRFSGARDFEYTPELGIFDLFDIPICHGWLVDPQEQEVAEVLRNCSYNQLVEKIINDKMSDETEVVRKALLSEQFLEQTASQLTYYGLCELNSEIKEDQLAVFFRNNHFNTLYMQKSSLYLLVTDQGFLQESQVVWETLNDVEGDSHFTDSNFRFYQKPEVSAELPSVNPTFVNTPEQLDSDYQLALSLANENANEETAAQPGLSLEEADFALARRLQEEEDKRAAEMAEGDEEEPVLTTPQTRPVIRSVSQPGHPAGMHGQTARPRAVSQQGRRRESGESCQIL